MQKLNTATDPVAWKEGGKAALSWAEENLKPENLSPEKVLLMTNPLWQAIQTTKTGLNSIGQTMESYFFGEDEEAYRKIGNDMGAEVFFAILGAAAGQAKGAKSADFDAGDFRQSGGRVPVTDTADDDIIEDGIDVLDDVAEEAIESGSKTIGQADRIKIDGWNYTPSDELYSKYKNVFDNPKYYNQKTGAINWPKNDGFASTPIDEVLQHGTRIDRYGSDFGSFTSPEGIPYEMRAVAPGTNLKPYSIFEVVKPINVKAGKIAPWFDEPGGGIQYLLPDTVDELLEAGVLRRIK